MRGFFIAQGAHRPAYLPSAISQSERCQLKWKEEGSVWFHAFDWQGSEGACSYAFALGVRGLAPKGIDKRVGEGKRERRGWEVAFNI